MLDKMIDKVMMHACISDCAKIDDCAKNVRCLDAFIAPHSHDVHTTLILQYSIHIKRKRKAPGKKEKTDERREKKITPSSNWQGPADE